MEATYKRHVVHAAADKAIAYWKAKYDERKAAWIDREARRIVGHLWWKRPLGQEAAEREFERATAFGEFIWEADFWYASIGIHGLSERVGPYLITLTAKEMNALAPVLALGDPNAAEGDER